MNRVLLKLLEKIIIRLRKKNIVKMEEEYLKPYFYKEFKSLHYVQFAFGKYLAKHDEYFIRIFIDNCTYDQKSQIYKTLFKVDWFLPDTQFEYSILESRENLVEEYTLLSKYKLLYERKEK